MNQTNKNNKLIAEFMGWADYWDHHEFKHRLKWHKAENRPGETEDQDLEECYGDYLWRVDNLENCGAFRLISKLKYHRNWHWLMPVVQKIANLDIDHEFSQVQENDVFDALVELDIEHLWQQTVTYIKWYNENV